MFIYRDVRVIRGAGKVLRIIAKIEEGGGSNWKERCKAELIEIGESHQKLNGKLQERLTEVEEENKKMHDHLDNQVQSARKAGI